jgi:hypothetical protein
MTAVRLYLDIDGVINAPYPEGAWPLSEVGTAEVPVDFGGGCYGKARLEWARKLIEHLAALDVDLVWATTWTSEAPTVAADVFGIGAGHRFLTPIDGRLIFPTISWKEQAVTADQSRSPSPFIWVDDELTPDHGQRMGALFPGRVCVVTSDEWTGITPAQVDRMTAFIDEMRISGPVPDRDARPPIEEDAA